MSVETTPRPQFVWHSAGPVEDFADGRPVALTLDGTPVAVVKAEGVYHAFRDECPHQGAPLCKGRFGGTMLPSQPSTLDYGLDGQIIRCPWHGWEFEIESGDAVFGIARRRLLKYATEERDGQLYIELPPKRQKQGRAS